MCKTFGFDRLLTRGLGVAVALALGVSACSRSPLDGAGSDDGLAQVVLALDAAPADVGCVVITASTDHPDRRAFSVTPGVTTTFTLPRLPVGVVVFAVDAYPSACSALGSNSVATWLGGPISVVLHAGANGPIAIVMKRNGEVKVSVDFGSGGATPICAAEGSACVANGDCCMNRCVVDPGQASGIGVCQAAVEPPPPPPPAGASVDVEFTGKNPYLFFSTDGGPGCGADGSATYSVSVSSAQGSVCISPSVGDVAPILVEQTSFCTAGESCQPCVSDSCKPASCFPPAPLAPAGGPCAHTLNVLPGQFVTNYLLLRRTDLNNPPSRPDGLPRLIEVSNMARKVTVTPPESQPDFAVARLGPVLVAPNNGGEMCSGLSLCGIVPYQIFGGSLFGSWFFSGGNLFSSPLF